MGLALKAIRKRETIEGGAIQEQIRIFEFIFLLNSPPRTGLLQCNFRGNLEDHRPQRSTYKIMATVSTSTMKVLWNGEPTQEFKPTRGLRLVFLSLFAWNV